MTVHIDNFDSTVDAEAPAISSTPAPHGGIPEEARRHRERLDQFARDAARTRAEGYDD